VRRSCRSSPRLPQCRESDMSIKSDAGCMGRNWIVLLLAAFCCVPLVARAECTFFSPYKMETVTINPGVTTLSLGRDRTGSLFVSPFVSPSASVHFSCTGTTTRAGVRNATGGIQPAAGTANIPIGDTGLFWRWRFTSPNRPAPGLLFSYGTAASDLAADSNLHFDGRTYAFELFSNGPVVAGTVIPAGTYGTFQAGTLNVLQMRLLNDITINTRTCITPDVAVPMRQSRIRDFPSAATGASSTPRTRFTLNINECPAEIRSVQFRFDVDEVNIVDSVNSVIRLSNPTEAETAQGVGLQLRDSVGVALQFNSFIPLTAYVAAPVGNTSSYQVNFDAGYFKTRMAAVTPGTANATIRFTMSYQ